ncbi:antibiotic biosynthesis monooxygenase family protein [Actinoplanes aureus]|uniref:DUF4865 family protein n=1 Tax=Actinoplanes aureus TaxID=2792083 RepID=A0A931CA98_9ACTN|nr:antibiotic biosynthesis monooxygenase [Actinoplanes aureus]MBG0566364.1 DUF4865 family protein [Actinoplanes aureus]
MSESYVAMTLYFRVAGTDAGELRALAEARAEFYRDFPGLVLKAFVHDAEAGRYGSHYIWRDEAAARAFRESDLIAQMVRRFGHQPEIHQYQVLALVQPQASDIGS